MKISVEDRRSFVEREDFDPFKLLGDTVRLYHAECAGGSVTIGWTLTGDGPRCEVKCSGCGFFEYFEPAVTAENDFRAAVRWVLVKKTERQVRGITFAPVRSNSNSRSEAPCS
jgi:hypothetical protein